MLPWELIEIVMANWDGRRLGLTCRRLSALMRPDRYVVVESVKPPHKVGCQDKREIVLSRLPNGVFHGESIAHTPYSTHSCRDVVTYNRGRIVSSTFYKKDNASPMAVDILIDGWMFSWVATMYTGGFNRVGVSIDRKAPKDDCGECGLDEFEAFARKKVSMYGITGNCTELPVSTEFARKHMPGTYRSGD